MQFVRRVVQFKTVLHLFVYNIFFIECCNEESHFRQTSVRCRQRTLHRLHEKFFQLDENVKHNSVAQICVEHNEQGKPENYFKTSDYVITQADLFPTLLDLGGIHSEWRGVGNSLLCPDSILNTEREKKRIKYREKISDIILDSDYFKGKKISK